MGLSVPRNCFSTHLRLYFDCFPVLFSGHSNHDTAPEETMFEAWIFHIGVKHYSCRARGAVLLRYNVYQHHHAASVHGAEARKIPPLVYLDPRLWRWWWARKVYREQGYKVTVHRLLEHTNAFLDFDMVLLRWKVGMCDLAVGCRGKEYLPTASRVAVGTVGVYMRVIVRLHKGEY